MYAIRSYYEAPITEGVTVTMTGGNALIASKKAFFSIYDLADLALSMGTPESAVGIGMIELDGSGNGSAGAVAPGTANPPVLLANHQYAVMLFVDMKPYYSDIIAAMLPSLGNASGIVPHYGDYVTDTADALTAAAGFTVDGNTLVPSSTYVYFVSQSGTGAGQVSADSYNFV